MPNRKSLLHVSLIVWLIVPSISAQTISTKLRYSFALGQKLTVTQEETTSSNRVSFVKGSKQPVSMIDTSLEIAQVWEVQSVSAGGDFVINVKYTSLRYSSSETGVKHFQLSRSQDPFSPPFTASNEFVWDLGRPIAETNPSLRQPGSENAARIEKLERMRKLMADVFMSHSFKIMVSDMGRVKSVKGFDEAWDTYRVKMGELVPDKTERANLDDTIEAFFGEDAVHKLFSYALFVGLPEQNVTVGQEWSDSTEFTAHNVRQPIRRNYKLASVSGEGRACTIEGKINFDTPAPTEEVEFTMTDSMILAQISLDPANGTILKQIYDGQLDIEIDGRQPPNEKLLWVVTDIHGSVKIAKSQ